MITLQRDNVVRKVSSEEAAHKLEADGFTRLGGAAEIDNPALLSGAGQGVNLQIDLDALAGKVAEIIKAGDPMTGEAVAEALLDDGNPDKPAAKADKPRGGKAAAKTGASHDGG